MVKVSGFTIVRNAIKLDFPVEASIRSILPICDEVVVNVGRSEDETLELVRSIDDPKIRIIETEWDMTSAQHRARAARPIAPCGRAAIPGACTSRPTRCCMSAAPKSWRRQSKRPTAIPRIEGLLVRYVHFYGGFDTIATHRRWYRREVRAVRLAPELDIRPYQGAQGFRVGPDHRKIRARLTGAEMFHYGWARPAQALREKRDLGRTMYPWRNADASRPLLAWMPGIRRFHGDPPSPWRIQWIEEPPA